MNSKEREKYISDLLSLPRTKDLKDPWFKLLFSELCKKVPTRLYKYRPGGSFGFVDDYLSRNRVYLSRIYVQDDKQEGITDSLEKTIKTTSLDDFMIQNKPSLVNGLLSLYPQVTEKQASSIHQLFENGEPSLSDCRKKMLEIIPDCDEELAYRFCKNILDALQEFDKRLNDNETIGETIIRIKDTNLFTGICSLTENKDDEVMWNEYASGFSGYCIEYDLTDYRYDVVMNLFPTIYVEKKDDNWLNAFIISIVKNISSFGLNQAAATEDFINWIIKTVCTKEKDRWGYQNEWRFLDKPDTLIDAPKISSVTVGYKISKEDFLIINDICNRKNIELKIATPIDGCVFSRKASEEDRYRILSSDQ